ELRLAPRQLHDGDGGVGPPLLLGAPLDARGAPAVGTPRRPALERALQPPDRAAPAVVAVPHVLDLRPDATARLPDRHHAAGRATQPAVPVLDPHRGDRAPAR